MSESLLGYKPLLFGQSFNSTSLPSRILVCLNFMRWESPLFPFDEAGCPRLYIFFMSEYIFISLYLPALATFLYDDSYLVVNITPICLPSRL